MKKKLLLILCVSIFTIPNTNANFTGNIPNKLVAPLNTYINKNVEVNCKSRGTYIEKSSLYCAQGDNNIGTCSFLIETTAKNIANTTFECTIKDKLKNTSSSQIIKGSTMMTRQIHVFDRTNTFTTKTLQTKTYSCEVSSTSDILSSIFGKNISEDELIKHIGKSKYDESAKFINGNWIWGNPDKGFVGNIHKDEKGNTASQRNLTGYGVYEKPIAQLYTKYQLNNKIVNNKNYTISYGTQQHLQEILSEFQKGNYVQLWFDYCTDKKYEDGELTSQKITQTDVDNGKNAKNSCWSNGRDRKIEWYYTEGKKLVKERGLIGEHNGYLLGFTGNIKSPKTIILWDTATGRHEYPLKEFLRKWEEMDYRSIIIYK